MIKKTIGILLLALFLCPFISATWNINLDLEPQNVSSGSTSVIWANISDSNGKPINPENCSQYTITYSYKGATETLDFMGNGVWASEFSTLEPYSEVAISGQGNCYGSFDSGSASKNLTFGNLSVNILNFPNILPRGKSITLSATVEYETYLVNTSNVTYYIYDLESNTVKESGKLTYSYVTYEKEITAPLTISDYILVVKAENNTNFGGEGKVFSTTENLEGDVNIKGEESRCDVGGSWCELGARVYINFTETIGKPDRVWAEIHGKELIKEFNLTEFENNDTNKSTWKGTYLIPVDFNLSKANKTSSGLSYLSIMVLAQNALNNFTYSEEIYLYTFTVNFIAKRTVLRGETIDLGFEVYKPVTGVHLKKEDLSKFDVSVYYAKNTTNLIWLKNYSLDDFSYINKVFHINYTVPHNAEFGHYPVIWNISDKFGHSPVSIPMWDFRVVEETHSGPLVINRTSIVNKFHKAGIYKEVLLFNNTADDRVIVRPIILGEISEILFGNFVLDETDPSVDSEYVMEAHSTRVFELGYNITKNLSESYEGKLVIRVFSDLQGTVEKDRAEIPLSTSIKFNVTNGTFGVDVNRIERFFTEAETNTQNISVINYGSKPLNITVELEGNVSDITSISEREFTLNGSSTKYVIFAQTVDKEDNGFYSGYYIFNSSNETIKVPVEITVDIPVFEEGKIALNVIGSNDLGTIIKGNPTNFRVNIKNIGTVKLSDFGVSSSTSTNPFSSSELEYLNLSSGENKTVTITLDTNKVSEGKQEARVIISASHNARNYTYVSFELIANYLDMFQSLNSSIEIFNEDLKEINATELIENKSRIRIKIVNLTNLIKQGIDKWNSGLYDKAKNIYKSAYSLKNAINSEIIELKTYTPPPKPKPSGSKWWLVIVVLVILIIIAVIIYLSIIPS